MATDNMMFTGNRKYTNGEITVYWHPKKCIHATTCYRELLQVFNPSKRPWVNMKGAPTKEIIRVVDLCPTEALTYKYNKDLETDKKEENTNQTEDVLPEVRIMEDGPVILKGKIKIFDADGSELRHGLMTSLCRCGISGSMPFCDGTHRKSGFKAK